jgi:hypothetical protein
MRECLIFKKIDLFCHSGHWAMRMNQGFIVLPIGIPKGILQAILMLLSSGENRG